MGTTALSKKIIDLCVDSLFDNEELIDEKLRGNLSKIKIWEKENGTQEDIVISKKEIYNLIENMKSDEKLKFFKKEFGVNNPYFLGLASRLGLDQKEDLLDSNSALGEDVDREFIEEFFKSQKTGDLDD